MASGAWSAIAAAQIPTFGARSPSTSNASNPLFRAKEQVVSTLNLNDTPAGKLTEAELDAQIRWRYPAEACTEIGADRDAENRRHLDERADDFVRLMSLCIGLSVGAPLLAHLFTLFFLP